jgi:hypothetical protein
MPLTTQGRNDLLTNGTTAFAYASAMSDLGTTEVTGVTRQAITFAAASSGARATSGTLTIPVGAGQTAQVGSVHSLVTAGTVEAWFQIGSTIRGSASVTTADLFTSLAHGLTTDDRVFFTTIAGEAIPTGISITTLYFVLATGLTADAFKVSTTSGGTALDVTVAGECAFFKTVPQPFPSGGNLVIASGALTVDLTFA